MKIKNRQREQSQAPKRATEGMLITVSTLLFPQRIPTKPNKKYAIPGDGAAIFPPTVVNRRESFQWLKEGQREGKSPLHNQPYVS